MRQAEIYRKGILAGILTEEGGEYRFCYDESYLAREDVQPVSLTLPLQTESYPQLPENEDLTMHLAEAAKISVVPHSLIRLADGELGYITKRIDRTKNGEKIDMEDMCQLTLHPTEYKYKGSHEQIAKTIAHIAVRQNST